MFITRAATQTTTLTLALFMQAIIFLSITGLVLWTMLMTPYGTVHDPFHLLRHALYLIPCH